MSFAPNVPPIAISSPEKPNKKRNPRSKQRPQEDAPEKRGPEYDDVLFLRGGNDLFRQETLIDDRYHLLTEIAQMKEEINSLRSAIAETFRTKEIECDVDKPEALQILTKGTKIHEMLANYTDLEREANTLKTMFCKENKRILKETISEQLVSKDELEFEIDELKDQLFVLMEKRNEPKLVQAEHIIAEQKDITRRLKADLKKLKKEEEVLNAELARCHTEKEKDKYESEIQKYKNELVVLAHRRLNREVERDSLAKKHARDVDSMKKMVREKTKSESTKKERSSFNKAMKAKKQAKSDEWDRRWKEMLEQEHKKEEMKPTRPMKTAPKEEQSESVATLGPDGSYAFQLQTTDIADQIFTTITDHQQIVVVEQQDEKHVRFDVEQKSEKDDENAENATIQLDAMNVLESIVSSVTDQQHNDEAETPVVEEAGNSEAPSSEANKEEVSTEATHIESAPLLDLASALQGTVQQIAASVGGESVNEEAHPESETEDTEKEVAEERKEGGNSEAPSSEANKEEEVSTEGTENSAEAPSDNPATNAGSLQLTNLASSIQDTLQEMVVSIQNGDECSISPVASNEEPDMVEVEAELPGDTNEGTHEDAIVEPQPDDVAEAKDPIQADPIPESSVEIEDEEGEKQCDIHTDNPEKEEIAGTLPIMDLAQVIQETLGEMISSTQLVPEKEAESPTAGESDSQENTAQAEETVNVDPIVGDSTYIEVPPKDPETGSPADEEEENSAETPFKSSKPTDGDAEVHQPTSNDNVSEEEAHVVSNDVDTKESVCEDATSACEKNETASLPIASIQDTLKSLISSELGE